MYNLHEVVNYIEKKYDVKLYDYQKRMLQCIIEGKTFYAPRASGRTFVLEGFIDYLRDKQNKHLTHGFDEHIGMKEVVKENKMIFDYYNLKDNTINFKLEFISEWNRKFDNL